MKTLKAMSVIAITWLLVQAAAADQISGQVFIVTNGHETIKLALVPIFVFNRDEVKRLSSDTQESSVLAANEFIDNVEKPSRDLDDRLRAEKRKRFMSNSAGHAYAVSNRLARDCTALRDDVINYMGTFLSPQRVFEKLRDPLGATKTDADGNFQIEVVSPSTSVIAAITSRSVMDKTEMYHWIVPVPNTPGKLMLSNDNMMSVDKTFGTWTEAEHAAPSLDSIKARLATLQKAAADL